MFVTSQLLMQDISESNVSVHELEIVALIQREQNLKMWFLS